MTRRQFAALAAAPLMAQPAPLFVCPMDPEIRSASPGKCSRCGMKLELGLPRPEEYGLRVEVTPRRIPPGAPLDWRFSVTEPRGGRPVTRFETVHERQFHLFLVRHDLGWFAHEHPELQADGTFRWRAALPSAGVYRLLADFYPSGGTPQFIARTVRTAGYTDFVPRLAKGLHGDITIQTGENLEATIEFDPPQPLAGKKTLVFLRLSSSSPLEPYLGAWAHLFSASHDLIDLVHSHPTAGGGSEQLQFDLFFPRAAVYRLWFQMQAGGIVNTVAFTIPVLPVA